MKILMAFILDIVFGDPEWLPHPVVMMGKWIHMTYRRLLSAPKHRQKSWGIVVALGNTAAVFLVTSWVLRALPYALSTIVATYILYTSLASKTLHVEAKAVKDKLLISPEEGRRQLSRIVGRETDRLSPREIICATVETVSENTSDGIIAPLFYAMLFGPAGAFAYKMINTMDSMVGYNNETYREAGYGAAKLDDVANYIPARITALLFCLTAEPKVARRSLKTVRRFHGAHLSPNAGWPESAAAGILGIQLGGGHYYFGQFVEKPPIGEALREPEPEDIDRICRAMWKVAAIDVALFEVIGLL
ncbi:MAG: adenosylcobinamide-phosphate synthase CbiB [Peptoniphilus sp.]|nr:adenosylcobinamide-phosphate synthase CbiB [Peptoniphilus sp.]MDD7363712.1 adenosylcobinamide-phosphate synthase CbiB [Bacillota bacterium]MDY6044097.1 adenosylcobinamide-phosphate synthase CbiB [Peptoniphilus sp.]